MNHSFESKVFEGLVNCGVSKDAVSSGIKIGVAVSGGADSVSLLVALSKILKKEQLKVITVNHGMRKKEETDGDADFVCQLCKKLSVECETVTFEEGRIQKIASKRGKGSEEAARNVRYEAFEAFIKKNNLDFLCLAHNKNDQFETVFMRLLNGSGIEGLSGIPQKRNSFIRPLLHISRAEIESYLVEQKISWRTDSTNLDNKYSRNKIRNLLIPFLNSNFNGWQNGIEAFIEKSTSDSSFIENCCQNLSLEKNCKQSENLVSVEKQYFYSLNFSLQRRLIYKIINRLGFGERFPFYLVKEICSWKEAEKKSVEFEGLSVFLKNSRLAFSIKTAEEKSKEEHFFSILDLKNPSFSYKNINFNVFEDSEGAKLCVKSDIDDVCCKVKLPVVVRSFEAGDEILCADGKLKKIADIFSDWKVPLAQRSKIPVVQEVDENLFIAAVLGSVSGYRNWIV